jgi:hypothetical protein
VDGNSALSAPGKLITLAHHFPFRKRRTGGSSSFQRDELGVVRVPANGHQPHELRADHLNRIEVPPAERVATYAPPLPVSA